MYIVIVGGGKVGWGAARDLISGGHEVCIVEREPTVTWAINDELGEVAVLGDGTEVHVQRAAGMGRADIVVACTGRDQANLAVCQMAQTRFGVDRVIARINDPRNEPIFQAVGINAAISATSAIVASIEQEVGTGLVRLTELRSSAFALLEVVIPPGAPAVGQTVRELRLPPHTVLTLILHPGGEPEVPGPDSLIQADAVVLAVTQPEHQPLLQRILTGTA